MTKEQEIQRIQSAQIVLQLIRKALNPDDAIILPQKVNWSSVIDVAADLGVLAVCFPPIEALPVNQRPDIDNLMDWLGQVEYLKSENEHQWDTALRLGELLAAEGVQLTLLKGRSVAQYYRVPVHRYSCDVDVFTRQFEKACEVLEAKGIVLEKAMYKDVSFEMDGVHFELHKFITPVRGNENLKRFEKYLRLLLECESVNGKGVNMPPLMFTALLWVEHALGDLLHGHLAFRQFVDWVVLRRQEFDHSTFEIRCREFGFDRFLRLADAIADVIEGKCMMESMEKNDRELLVSLLEHNGADGVARAGKWLEKQGGHSWLKARIRVMTEILASGRLHARYGYQSMPKFLWNKVWSHFFEKDVEL